MINNSIAIYADVKSSNIGVNYNIWVDFETTCYLDISINLDSCHVPTQNINVFVPFKVNEDEIKDLSPLYKNEKIATGILNRAVSSEEFKEKHYIKISFEQGMPIAFIQLNDSNYSVTNLDSHSTMIKFRLLFPDNYHKACVIFRIPFSSLTEQIHDILSNKRRWVEVLETPIMQRTYPFDFRVNEARSLPNAVAKKAEIFEIERQSFFINVPININVDRYNCEKVRNIETDIFKEYFPSKSFEKGGLSYLWAYRSKSTAIVSTVLTYRKLSILSISLYLLIVAIINILSGIASNIICKLFFN